MLSLEQQQLTIHQSSESLSLQLFITIIKGIYIQNYKIWTHICTAETGKRFGEELRDSGEKKSRRGEFVSNDLTLQFSLGAAEGSVLSWSSC